MNPEENCENLFLAHIARRAHLRLLTKNNYQKHDNFLFYEISASSLYFDLGDNLLCLIPQEEGELC